MEQAIVDVHNREVEEMMLEWEVLALPHVLCFLSTMRKSAKVTKTCDKTCDTAFKIPRKKSTNSVCSGLSKIAP